MQLAITGATGHIGGQVVRLLNDQDLPQLIGREPLTFEQVVRELANPGA